MASDPAATVARRGGRVAGRTRRSARSPRRYARSDDEPLRTEDADGVWACKAASLADPEVRTALRPAVRGEVRVPTRSEGETLDDLLADRSAVEDVDADAAGEQGYGCVRPVQPPVEHLLGARYRPLERGLT